MTFSILLFLPCIAPAQHSSFFPAQPTDAAVHTYTGTITHYGVGTGRGDLTVVDAKGRAVSFAVSQPFRVNGKVISCHQAPRLHYHPPTFLCSDWPSSVILGRSKVRAVYWFTVEMGVAVKASDSINTVP